jgi:hypothetical protein
MHSNLFDLCNLISGGTDPEPDGTCSGTFGRFWTGGTCSGSQLKLTEPGPFPRGTRNGTGRQLYPAQCKNVNLFVFDKNKN